MAGKLTGSVYAMDFDNISDIHVAKRVIYDVLLYI